MEGRGKEGGEMKERKGTEGNGREGEGRRRWERKEREGRAGMVRAELKEEENAFYKAASVSLRFVGTPRLLKRQLFSESTAPPSGKYNK